LGCQRRTHFELESKIFQDHIQVEKVVFSVSPFLGGGGEERKRFFGCKLVFIIPYVTLIQFDVNNYLGFE
jgi:hypothetical protein